MNIKFVGDFKKLIPMGFKFHKLFANNYKVYERDKVWIWVAHGGYVEIDDLYDQSCHIAKMVLDETYPVYEEDKDYKVFVMEKGRPKSCIMNKQTGEIIPYAEFIQSIRPEEHYDHEQYREVNLRPKTMETIKEIRNMIEIEGLD